MAHIGSENHMDPSVVEAMSLGKFVSWPSKNSGDNYLKRYIWTNAITVMTANTMMSISKSISHP